MRRTQTRARARSPESQVRLVAADLMTENPRTVRVDDPIGEAVEAMQAMEVRHLPVVDDEGDLVGMLSDRDLGRRVHEFTEEDSAIRALPFSRRPVSQYMTGSVIYVDPDTTVEEIVEKLLDERVGALPVVDGDGEVVGIVSYVDVLRAAFAVGGRS